MTIEFADNIENNRFQSINFGGPADRGEVNKAPVKEHGDYKVVNLSIKRFLPGGDSGIAAEIHGQAISQLMLGSL